jgi:hypothetical protein
MHTSIKDARNGKHAAQQTFHSGGYRRASFPVSFWDNISYCIAYHIGYDSTWGNYPEEIVDDG